MRTHPPSGRFVLLSLLAFTLVPIFVAYGFYWWAPALTTLSVGQLLPTKPFLAASLPGWPIGSWSLVSVETGPCDNPCQQRRFTLRQIRLAQGEAAMRIARVRVLALPEPSGSAEEVGLHAPHLVAQLSRPGYYLVDPLGNQVMFYADASDPVRVMREVGQLIKINNAL